MVDQRVLATVAFDEGLPAPWEPFRIAPGKKPTRYDLVADQGTIVLHARADAAASALRHDTRFDLRAAPIIEFRWKISRLIDDQDNAIATREDSPVRVILEFQGDRSRLSFRDRTSLSVGDTIAGREVPYATLMYIWSGAVPVGTVIPNPHAKRIQMIVASSGTAGVGKWQTLKRNVRDDYKRAFNEEPGLLKSVGVMTDTDNTGASVEAWYGDLQFSEP
jgi:hypothetical protein